MTAPSYRTQTELRSAFDRIGFRPDKLRGQNFLVDGNLMGIAAESGELTKDDVVLEIGAGTGALTMQLAESAGHVIAVEIEEKLRQLAAEQTADFENVTLLCTDALDGSGRLSRRVADSLKDRMAEAACSTYKLVSNLPYGCATPVVEDALCRQPASLLAVTVQREVAERMTASPGSREYGLLSVIVQATATAERLRDIPRTAFWPAPAVTSALIRLRPSVERRAATGDLEAVIRVAKGLFSARRKRAANALALSGICSTKKQADAVLQKCGVSPEARGDSLTVDEIVAVANEPEE